MHTHNCVGVVDQVGQTCTHIIVWVWLIKLVRRAHTHKIYKYSKNVDTLKRGGLYLKPPETTKKLSTYLSCHNFFPLSSVQIIIVPACCLLCVL